MCWMKQVVYFEQNHLASVDSEHLLPVLPLYRPDSSAGIDLYHLLAASPVCRIRLIEHRILPVVADIVARNHPDHSPVAAVQILVEAVVLPECRIPVGAAAHSEHQIPVEMAAH